MGGGGAVCPSLSCGVCPLLKKSLTLVLMGCSFSFFYGGGGESIHTIFICETMEKLIRLRTVLIWKIQGGITKIYGEGGIWEAFFSFFYSSTDEDHFGRRKIFLNIFAPPPKFIDPLRFLYDIPIIIFLTPQSWALTMPLSFSANFFYWFAAKRCKFCLIYIVKPLHV